MDVSDRTLYCSNLPHNITEELLFELFLQAGPVANVKIPKDKEGKFRQFGFVEFKHTVSVPYAIELMSGTQLFGRDLKIQPRNGSTHSNPQSSESKFHRSMSVPDMSRTQTPLMNQCVSPQFLLNASTMPNMGMGYQNFKFGFSPQGFVPQMGMFTRNDTLPAENIMGNSLGQSPLLADANTGYQRTDSRHFNGGRDRGGDFTGPDRHRRRDVDERNRPSPLQHPGHRGSSGYHGNRDHHSNAPSNRSYERHHSRDSGNNQSQRENRYGNRGYH